MLLQLKLEMRYRRIKKGERPMYDRFRDMFTVCKWVSLWLKSLVASHNRQTKVWICSLLDVFEMQLLRKVTTELELQHPPNYRQVSQLSNRATAMNRRTTIGTLCLEEHAKRNDDKKALIKKPGTKSRQQ